MIEAKIVADSVGPNGVRLTTFVLTYPRFIHSEFMTHRTISRNASSSRAIPVKKQIQMVIDNPAIPLAFTKNKPGMQGGEALEAQAQEDAVRAWLNARDAAVNYAQILSDLEVHKQYANRILEPYAHITVVATATDWDNFFALRCHYMAQPEICALAMKMLEAYQTNEPKFLEQGEWHLPFITEADVSSTANYEYYQDQSFEPGELLLWRSVAKCARVSYLNHEGKPSTEEEDIALYKRLLGSIPIHASPAEHQARALGWDDEIVNSGNLRGWVQYRKTLEGENVTKFMGPVLEP